MPDHCAALESHHFVLLTQRLKSSIRSPRKAGFLINIFLAIPNSSILVPEVRSPPPKGLFQLFFTVKE